MHNTGEAKRVGGEPEELWATAGFEPREFGGLEWGRATVSPLWDGEWPLYCASSLAFRLQDISRPKFQQLGQGQG